MISNKIYKKILTVALGTALFSLPLFTACESDVVDLQPIDKFSDLTAYSTPDRCELSVIGAYDAAQCGLYINTGNGLHVVTLLELPVFCKARCAGRI